LLAFVLRQPSQRIARLAVVVSMAMLVVALAGLTIQAVTRTGLGAHQVRWLFALGPFVHVTILWGAVEWAAQRWPASSWLGRRLDAAVGVVLAALTIANLPFHAHDLGPTADRASRATLERTLDDVSRFDPDGPVVYDVDNLRAYEPYSMAVMMRMREQGVGFRFDDEPMVRQMGERRRADGTEQIHVRQYERAEALLYDGDGCVISLRSAVAPDEEEAADALIAAATEDLASGTLDVDVSDLAPDVAGFVQSAAGGNADDALRIVVSGLLVQLVEEGRLPPTPAITAAVDEHDAILDRANSTLLVVATPASACDA
jgi:hypothetical protein